MKKFKEKLVAFMMALCCVTTLNMPVSADENISALSDVYTTKTMSLSEFAIERTHNANYEGIYYNNADSTSYIYNNGTSCLLQGVYAQNGDYVRAVTEEYELGQDSTQNSYGFHTFLLKDNYLKLVNGNWTTNGTNNTSVTGNVTVVKKNGQYYYSYITICTDQYNYMQVFVQEHS